MDTQNEIDCKQGLTTSLTKSYVMTVVAVCYARGVRYEPGSALVVDSEEARDYLVSRGAAQAADIPTVYDSQVAAPRVKRNRR